MTELNATTSPVEQVEMLQNAQRMISGDYVNGFLFELAFPTVADARIVGLWKDAPTQATDLTAVYWTD